MNNTEDLNYLQRSIDPIDDTFDVTQTESSSYDKIAESTEEYKQMMESMKKFSSLNRRTKRKIIKPSFSTKARLALRK